ncbi:MAG: DUF3299 domain-containing protein [Bauldia sp.]
MARRSTWPACTVPAIVAGAFLLAAPAGAAALLLEWQDLIPTSAQIAQGVVKGVVAHEDIAHLPAAEQQASAPIRTDLDGREVKIGGYVVPLAFKGTAVTEFLLAPFVGACVHVPAPPANQLVYISYPKGIDLSVLTASVWVTGPMKASLLTTDLAAVGYRIEAATVAPADF